MVFVCRNCLRLCKTFLKQKEQIKVKLNNSVLLINNIHKIQDQTHQTRKRPQLEQGGPPRKRLFFLRQLDHLQLLIFNSKSH